MMNYIVSTLSRLLALALGLLAACHSSSPVTANSAEPSADLIGNVPSSEIGIPDNAAATERPRHAAQILPSNGMSWRWDSTRTTARFGPSPAVTAFSIECDADRDQLIFHRFVGAPARGAGTMSFTGNGHVASLSAAMIGNEENQASSWQAAAPPSDLTVAVAKVFAGADPVEIAVSGSAELVTAPSPITQQPFAACHH